MFFLGGHKADKEGSLEMSAAETKEDRTAMPRSAKPLFVGSNPTHAGSSPQNLSNEITQVPASESQPASRISKRNCSRSKQKSGYQNKHAWGEELQGSARKHQEPSMSHPMDDGFFMSRPIAPRPKSCSWKISGNRTFSLVVSGPTGWSC